MAFTEQERVQVRRWLGYPAVYTDSFRGLEDNLTRAQATADGGLRPDNTTELAVRGYLANLTAIDAKLMVYVNQMQAHKVDENVVDSIRGMGGLNQLARRYVGFLADVLDTRPLRDVFSPPKPGAFGTAWSRFS